MMISAAPLESAFVGRLSRLAGGLVVGNADGNAVRCDHLILPNAIANRLQRLTLALPDASRQSLVVLWVRLHVARLLAAVMVPALILDRWIPVGLDQCRAIFSVETGYPQAIQVMDTAAEFTTDDPFERFASLVWQHLAPFIAALALHGRTSPKLLWSNAGFELYSLVRRTVQEAESLDLPVHCDAQALFRQRLWPDGRRNPLFEPWHPEPAADGGPRRRKACCLYYKLKPDNKLCGNCPIGIKQEKVQA
ncbi:siderophore-iron reductase FhuF [Pusillimonas noertemannii]|uniref:Ferric iron reductase protein FhuF n=1 Tax=Pusillimonas noertemannii TaxID=305977 RepID=A0A2U1CMA3_9BURK|nr:siderophore-iron reductase FhuF [Pusillimonas noertemannii]NYT68865.1 siderophore-iron reductase FhuF [Pusillimonas noertemannii]PVY62114.1 ferric iron reductase protein FhuF [Pusillimonas noertemannii]TFL10892.1 siderophore-iron reductase FhuF [Pusillimonas noertemannii]